MSWTYEQNCEKAILYMSTGCWNHCVKFPIQSTLATKGISLCYILQSHVTSTTFTFYKPQVVVNCFLWYMLLSLHCNLNECTCFNIVSSFIFKVYACYQWNTTFCSISIMTMNLINRPPFVLGSICLPSQIHDFIVIQSYFHTTNDTLKT